MGRVLEPHEWLARYLQAAGVALDRCAGGHLVLSSLHHHHRHVELGQAANYPALLFR